MIPIESKNIRKTAGTAERPQMQFLIGFLDHRVAKSCKVTRTAT